MDNTMQEISTLKLDLKDKTEWETRVLRKKLTDKILNTIQENLDDPLLVSKLRSILKEINTFKTPPPKKLEPSQRNVTKDLLEILTQENIKSQNSLLILTSSNEILKKSDDHMQVYSRNLVMNSKIVKSLKRKDVRERILLVIGLIVFFSSITFIISKRFFKFNVAKDHFNVVKDPIQNFNKDQKQQTDL
jgi:hypothetical protein